MILHWALQGPLKGSCDYRDSARLCLPFLKKINSLNPLNIMERVYGHCCTSPRFREPSWNFLDPQMDPKIDPARLILGDPCKEKTLQGPFNVHIDQFFL